MIYLLTCNHCRKQHVAETTKSFSRKITRNEICMQEHLFRHSDSEDHSGFLENASITLIDKTDGRDANRKDDYWRRTLKTYAHCGLNSE